MLNPPIFWYMPYRQNSFFTGREEILLQLRAAFVIDHTVALTQPQSISGLGGIGKTQTAIEYMHRYASDYQAAFWVRANSLGALVSDFVAIAHLLTLPERDEQDQLLMVEAVLGWLRTNSSWLLVLDNVEDVNVVETFLPLAGRGHILLTTRAQALGGIAQKVTLEKMPLEIGALFLLRRAGIIPLHLSLDAGSDDDRILASTISGTVDGFPLALDQAGAYISETHCSLQAYLEFYQARRRELLEIRGRVVEDYPDSVATTWSLSFEKVTWANPAAAELLEFCAYLAPDAIPEEMVSGGASYFDPLLQSVVADPLLFDRAIATLLAYSFVTRNADDALLSVHRLVQAVLQENMPVEKEKQWKQRVVQTVDDGFHGLEFAHWSMYERYLPHALLCTEWIERGEQLAIPEVLHLLNQVGAYLRERGRYTEAKQVLMQAVTNREQQEEKDDVDMATSLNNLGAICKDLGEHEQAQLLYMRALTIRERQLGEHPATAHVLQNLAELYREQGKYEQAEPLYKQALDIHEKHLEPEHPDIAQVLNNLAGLYRDQGKYEQAEPLYERALTIREQRLGLEHPDTAQTISNLAACYRDQGKYEQAEPLYERALSICEQHLGPQHSNTAQCLNSLAVLYQDQEKYSEAEPLLVRALSICERHLGPEHPDTAQMLNNLARLYRVQEKYERAELLYGRVLMICEQHLGPEHPNTVHALNNLAFLNECRGRYDQAETLYARASSICEQYLDSKHPLARLVRGNYVSFLQARKQEQKKLFARKIEAWLKKLARLLS